MKNVLKLFLLSFEKQQQVRRGELSRPGLLNALVTGLATILPALNSFTFYPGKNLSIREDTFTIHIV